MAHAVVARLTRSGFVEGEHTGSGVAIDPGGEVIASVGEPGLPVFPRSANKPLQVVGMLRAGLRLDGSLLALAAASHSGERFHLDGVERILAGAGLTVDTLQNAPDLPLDPQERASWLVAGRPASSLAANCSGKHAAMLATSQENDWSLRDYLDPGHPLQRGLAETVAELAGEPVGATGVDACGAPVFAVSLLGLARAFAAIATAPAGTTRARVAESVRRHPEWLGGTGREVTALIRGVPGLVAKDGAEGVFAAALPDGRAVAVKIADGAERARSVLLAALLHRLGVDAPVLDALASIPVLGHGRPVGAIEAVEF